MLIAAPAAEANVTAVTIVSASQARGLGTVTGTVTCTAPGNQLGIVAGLSQNNTAGATDFVVDCVAAGTQSWSVDVVSRLIAQGVVFRNGAATASACARDNTAGDADTSGWAVCTGDQPVFLRHTHK